MLEAEITVGKTYCGEFGSDRHVEHIYDQRQPARVWWKNEFNGTGVQDLRSFAEWAKSETPNDRVEGRDAASSRRVPSHDGLCGNGSEKESSE
jgi:hypothetical protein